MGFRLTTTVLFAGVCAAALAYAAAASAQQAPGAAPASTGASGPAASSEPVQAGEVVVTAQKRVERVQDVPVAVTVVSTQQLQRQNITAVNDLSQAVPSLEVQDVPGQGGGPAIRGIGTEANSLTSENSVALVVDGVVLGRQPLNDLFDISRVEVLRGPQGMLFGKNASAGVINITTNAPNPNAFQASAHVDQGFMFGYGVYQGMLNIPLGSTAALRIAAHDNTESGLTYNTLTHVSSSNDDYGLRARLLWEPTNNLTINLIGEYDQNWVNGEFLQYDWVGPSAYGISNILASCGITASRGNRDYCGNYPTEFLNTTYGGSIQIDYRLGDYTLTSITSNRQSPSKALQDIDTTPVDLLDNHSVGWTGTTSQEFRVTSPAHQPVEFVAGFYFSDTENKGSGLGIGTVPLPILLPTVPPTLIYTPPIDSPTLGYGSQTSYALFGQATGHVTDKLRLILGLRETYDEVSTSSYNLMVTPHPVTSASDDVWNLSYKAGIQYDFSRNLMAYATYSAGYKGPQVNLPTSAIPVGGIVAPEMPTAYEVGVKGSLFGGKLAMDLNAFYTSVHDYQTQVLVNSNQGPQFIIGNVPEVYTRGVELDVFGSPVHGLTINGGITYDLATYGNYTAQNIELNYVSVHGDQIAFTPLWKATLSAEYEHHLFDWANGFVQADVVYKSPINFDAAPDPRTTLGNTVTVGARVGLRSPDGRWDASIFVRNLGDSRIPANLQVGPLENFIGGFNGGVPSVAHVLSLDSFRMVGITLDGKF